MSPWTIYWILQLDSINRAIFAVILLSGVGLIGFGIYGAALRDTCYEDQRLRGEAVHRKVVKALGMFLVLFLFHAFLPTTKTVAAVVILPAVVNNKMIQKESGELYQLAKKALERASAVPEEVPDKKH